MTLKPSQDCLDILHRLIAFDTTSRNSNLELIDYVKSLLDDHSVPYRLTYDDEGRKANLLATVGPADMPGGYVLSGHTDVVPVDGQDWHTDPFELTEVDGKLFGRGTTDMKSFVAVVLASLQEFQRRGLQAPLHMALSYDEEVGLIGVRRLIADMCETGVRPEGCIVGEPTSMRIVTSHKGKRSYRCKVRGMEAHSSLAPSGVNAVEYAGAVIAFLQNLSRRHRNEGPFDEEYDCAHTTVHVGTVRGGTALNIVPAECTFEFEFRHLPGDDPEEIFGELRAYVENDLVPEMQEVHSGAGIVFEPMATIPSLDTDEDSQVTQLAKAITGDNSVRKVSYNCEACLFDDAGVPTIICGPGDIDQAHKPNEFIELDQIAKCETFMQGLMERVCKAH
jgi:acetylornithine deacetylase